MNGRLLLVDDEKEIRDVLGALLQREGLAVTLAESADEALQTLETLGPQTFDMILCDVRMPGIDGIEFLAHAKALGCSAAIVMMSGQATVEDAVSAMKLGAYDYVSKPVNVDEIVLTLGKVSERATLLRDNQRLRAAVKETYGLGRVVAATPPMARVLDLLLRAAESEAPVLFEAEDGTGKEFLARVLHFQSNRRDGPFAVVHCGLPSAELDRELFGEATSARSSEKAGRLAEAGGTLYLEDVDRLPLPLQLRLSQRLRRPAPGEERLPRVSARLVSGTTRALAAEVRAGRFREDLFHCLSVVPLRLPPLRERPEDLPLLAERFARRSSAETGRPFDGISPEAVQLLLRQPWRGNLRELETAVERAMVLSGGRTLDVEQLLPWLEPEPSPVPQLPPGELSVKKVLPRVEAELIRKALLQAAGNRAAACRLLGMSLRSLLYKIKRFGIESREAKGVVA